MSGAFLSPTTCGFAKIAALHASKSARSTKKERENLGGSPRSLELKARYDVFCDIFQDRQEGFSIDMQTFNKRFPALQNAINKWDSKKKAEKETYFDTFSVDNWMKLSPSRKQEHCFVNCNGCFQSYAAVQAVFPVKSLRLKSKAKTNPFLVASALNDSNTRACKTLQMKNVMDGAKAIYQTLNPAFEKWSGVPFAVALTKVPEANVERKRSKAEKKKARRDVLRKAKEKTQENWNETSLIR